MVEEQSLIPAVTVPRLRNGSEHGFAQQRARGEDFLPLERSDGKVES